MQDTDEFKCNACKQTDDARDICATPTTETVICALCSLSKEILQKSLKTTAINK